MDSRMRELFESRGIRTKTTRGKELIESRPYVPYRKGEVQDVWAVDSKYRDVLEPGRKRFITRVVNERDGIVMNRHACLEGVADPWAQLRPWRDEDDPGIATERFSHRHVGTYVHRHGGHRHNVGGWWVNPKMGVREDPVARYRGSYGKAYAARHLREREAPWGQVSPKLFEQQSYLRHRKGRTYFAARGENVPQRDQSGGWHAHYHRWDAHLYNDDYIDQHVGVTGSKAHEHIRYAKYLYVPGQGRAMGLDVHPMSSELIDRGSNTVFFALEGILKSDAILYAGAPVFNCGSVTLWGRAQNKGGAPELERFVLERLIGHFGRCVVVPDSDWSTNPQVARHAQTVANFITSLGLPAIIAAPPSDPKWCTGGICPLEHRKDPNVKKHKVGVDDFLGAGGTLSDLVTLERRMSPAGADYAAQRRREALLMEYLQRTCDISGKVYQSVDEIGDGVGVSRVTVMEAIHDLSQSGGPIDYEVEPPGDSRLAASGVITLAKKYRPELAPRRLGDV